MTAFGAITRRTIVSPPGPAALLAGWDSRVARLVPYVFAATTGFQILAYLVVQPLQIGYDARLYTDAARAWLAGSDPWTVTSHGIAFAAPPPTLLIFAPFTLLSGVPITVIWVGGSFVLAALALRSLHAPMWWLFWWPIVDGCLVGNPDVAVLFLLVALRGRLSAIAPLAKIYAFGPLIGERRWRAIAGAIAIILVTVPILPWGQYFRDADQIAHTFMTVSATTSIFGQPILMAIAGIALLSLGIRRASWLTVPVLWPYTEPHYLALSVPAMSPWLAIAWSFPNPIVVFTGIVVEAVMNQRQRAGQPRSVSSS